MRQLAKAATLFILCPVIVYAVIDPRLPATAMNSVLVWEADARSSTVKFKVPCYECSSDGSTSLDFELNIEGSSSGHCRDTIISLNGEVLHHQWGGSHGAGTGLFSVDILDYLGSSLLPVLTASWHSFCLSPMLNETSQPETQVLSLKVEGIENHPLTESVGFTISFTASDGLDEIFRLSDAPFDDMPDTSTLKSWQYPSPLQKHTAMDDVATPIGQTPLETLIEQELAKLRKLRKEALDLHRAIRAKEDEVRELLNRDCKSIFDKWHQCDHNFGCMVGVSIQSLPEIYRSLKYQFIPLQGYRYPPACPAHSRASPSHSTHPGGSSTPTSSPPTSNPTFPPKSSSNPTNLIGNPTLPTLPPAITLHNSGEQSAPFPGHIPEHIPNPSSPKSREALHGLTLLLVVALTILLLKLIHRSQTCRRRRLDRRARNEERRARRAYESAACRLRWQRWWYGRNFLPRSAGMISRHSLEILEEAQRGDTYHPSQEQPSSVVQEQVSDDSLETAPVPSLGGQGAMEQEIMGFRRVLEFVGQLVRHEDREPSRSASSPREFHYTGNTRSYRDIGVGIDDISRAFPEGSSRGRTSGLNSSRSSSLLSLETESLITQESLEAAPPAYRE